MELQPSSSSLAPPNAPLISKASSKLTRSDFSTYFGSISDSYHLFEDIRNHSTKDLESSASDSQSRPWRQSTRHVLARNPSLYFMEDFALEDGVTFRTACPFSTAAKNLVLKERLSQCLDVVGLGFFFTNDGFGFNLLQMGSTLKVCVSFGFCVFLYFGPKIRGIEFKNSRVMVNVTQFVNFISKY